MEVDIETAIIIQQRVGSELNDFSIEIIPIILDHAIRIGHVCRTAE